MRKKQRDLHTCTGVGVNTLNLEVATLEEVTEAISKAAGFVIGSPTLGGHMPTQVPCSPLPLPQSSTAAHPLNKFSPN